MCACSLAFPPQLLFQALKHPWKAVFSSFLLSSHKFTQQSVRIIVIFHFHEWDRKALPHSQEAGKATLAKPNWSFWTRKNIANSVKMVSVTRINVIIYSDRPKLSAKSCYISSQHEQATSKPFLFRTKWNRNQRISAILRSDTENYIMLMLPLNS